tara:strand:+ start:284 stop:553 length:270 start_codon:yes stop_codon:yes gene_type:complete
MSRLKSRVDRLADKAIPKQKQMLVLIQLIDPDRREVIPDRYCCKLDGDDIRNDVGETLESFRERVRAIAIKRRIQIISEVALIGKCALT